MSRFKFKCDEKSLAGLKLVNDMITYTFLRRFPLNNIWGLKERGKEFEREHMWGSKDRAQEDWIDLTRKGEGAGLPDSARPRQLRSPLTKGKGLF